MRTRITNIGLACLIALAGPVAAGTILQWGFDYTTGAVAVPITDDSGAGHPGTTLQGSGGATYSADIPSAAMTQNVTGIGSVNFATGTHAGISTAQTATPAQIWAAGGLTLEVWVKNPVKGGQYAGFALCFGDGYNLGISSAGRIGFATAWGGDNVDTNDYAPGEWNHLAAVIVPTRSDCGSYNISAYLNGRSIGSKSLTRDFLPRVTVVGNASDGNVYNNYNGLVYEPRISLGALTPGEFTVVPPTGDLSALPTVSGVTNGSPIALTVKVNNAGTTAYHVSAAAFTGTNAANFSGTGNTFPITIPASGSADVLVNFTPTAGGTATATLALTTDDPFKATLTVQLSVEVHDPKISIASIFNCGLFKDIPGPTAQDFSVQNLGSAHNLTLSNPQITGAGAAAYSLTMPGPISPSGSGALQVTFNPTAPGNFPAQLSLDTNDPFSPTVTVTLAGVVASSGTPILQWGFDYTTGAVGVPITDDSGNSHPGTNLFGNGGATYSDDIPSPSVTQHVTGIGSVNFATASTATISTTPNAPIATAAQIWAAGGADDGGLGEKSRPGRSIHRCCTQLC